MARYTNCINVGSVVDSLPVDVLPLSVEPATAEEVRVLKAFQAGCSLEEITQGFPKSLEIVGRSCWTFLVTTALNYLNLGLRAPPLEPVGNAWVNASPAQVEAVRYLKEQVSVFVELMPGTMPEVHWERALDARRSSYDGELLLKACPSVGSRSRPRCQSPRCAGASQRPGWPARTCRSGWRSPSSASSPSRSGRGASGARQCGRSRAAGLGQCGRSRSAICREAVEALAKIYRAEATSAATRQEILNGLTGSVQAATGRRGRCRGAGQDPPHRGHAHGHAP